MTAENKGRDNEAESSSSQTSSKEREYHAERVGQVFRTIVHLIDGSLPLSPKEDKLLRAQVEQDEEIQQMLKDKPQLTMFERWAVQDEREKHEKLLAEERQRSKQAKQQAKEAKQQAKEAKQQTKEAKQQAKEAKQQTKEAKQQAKEAKRLANLAEQRAKQAEQRASLLETRLRELGVDP